MAYTMRRDCIECLEHYLLFLDAGLSETTAAFFAGLWHVTSWDQDPRLPSRFGKLARLHCMARFEAALDADFDAMLHNQ
jgi:hypothetical protein